MKKVAFYTLGCKLNFSETSTLARQLKDRGFKQVPFDDTPDIYVINTCSVTENADRKCRKIVRDALKVAPQAFIAIVGCYAQLKPSEIAEIQGVDAVLGASEKFQLAELLGDFVKKPQTQVMACDIQAAKSFYPSFSSHDRTRAFLKVQDGCDYSCAFCTIPLARGSSRSGTIDDILAQARSLAASEAKEIVLTGVNIGDYGKFEGHSKARFMDLLKVLDELEGIDRIRISSIEPNLLTEDIISLVARSKKFVPHFHIPLQSGSDTILKRMRRRYLSDLYADRVQQIKELIPGCCIGADVIVGFPGESEAHFNETYLFLVEQKISYLHVFTYSERENTLASTFSEVVSNDVRSLRSRMLRNLSAKKKRAFYQGHLGETHQVLFENDLEAGVIHGFTRNYIRVGVPFVPGMVNSIKEVRLDQIADNGTVIAQVMDLEATLK